MKMIVGLGNPTKEYENTFHNLGFLAVDALADHLSKKLKKAECSALTATFSYGGETVVLAKPLTYMNLSGQAVKGLLAKYGGTPQDLVVLYDDFDLPLFRLRARAFGGAGTHNGMRSIVSLLGTGDFKRVRIGIGQTLQDKKDFVLSPIKKEDAKQFDTIFVGLAKALTDFLADDDFNKLMKTLNTDEPTPAS